MTCAGLLFTCLTDWCLSCPRRLLAAVTPGWIIQKGSFSAYFRNAHSIHMALNKVPPLFSGFLCLLAYLSPSPCLPNFTLHLSGGEGEPRPDSGHHNEDPGEKERPDQLHWIPTAHGGRRCGRWADERKEALSHLQEIVFCDSGTQALVTYPSYLHISINHWVLGNVLSALFLQSSWLTDLSRSSRTWMRRPELWNTSSAKSLMRSMTEYASYRLSSEYERTQAYTNCAV